jgi:hypothetical protein
METIARRLGPQPIRFVVLLRLMPPRLRGLGTREGTQAGATADAGAGTSWRVETADGEEMMPLSAELAEHYYGDATVNRVRLWLHAGAAEGEQVLPHVEVLPAPTRNPMTVTVLFASGETRTLTVPPSSGGLRKGQSTEGEPLPAASLSAAPLPAMSIELR